MYFWQKEFDRGHPDVLGWLHRPRERTGRNATNIQTIKDLVETDQRLRVSQISNLHRVCTTALESIPSFLLRSQGDGVHGVLQEDSDSQAVCGNPPETETACSTAMGIAIFEKLHPHIDNASPHMTLITTQYLLQSGTKVNMRVQGSGPKMWSCIFVLNS